MAPLIASERFKENFAFIEASRDVAYTADLSSSYDQILITNGGWPRTPVVSGKHQTALLWRGENDESMLQ